MGAKVAKSSSKQSDYSSQRIFLCDHCYQRGSSNNSNSICRNCSNIDLNVCFYPFSDPIIPSNLERRQELFQDSLESLFANVSCCGIIKRNDVKSNSFALNELPPKITHDDLVNTDLGGGTRSSFPFPREESLGWLALLNETNRQYEESKPALFNGTNNPGSVDSNLMRDSFSSGPDFTIPVKDTELLSNTINATEIQILTSTHKTSITDDKQDVGTSISETQLSLMSIHLELGNSSCEDEYSEYSNDPSTVHTEPKYDCCGDWKKKDFSIEIPLLNKESGPSKNVSKLTNEVELNSNTTVTSKEPDNCVLEIMNWDDSHISLVKNNNEFNETGKLKEIENHGRQQTGILSTKNNRERQSCFIIPKETVLETNSYSKQVNFETELVNNNEKSGIISNDWVNDWVNEEKLTTPEDQQQNKNVDRNLLPTITKEDSFYNIFNKNKKKLPLNDNNKNDIKMWTKSFENILHLCRCNQKLIDVQIYGNNLVMQNDKGLAFQPETYTCGNTITVEDNVPKIGQRKTNKKYLKNQEDIAVNQNIPLQLQGAFPDEGSAFYSISNLRRRNGKSEQTLINISVSNSNISLMLNTKPNEDEDGDLTVSRRIFNLVEGIINELLPYFTTEIIQKFKTLENPDLLDILIDIMKDLKSAKYILQLLKDMPYHLIKEGNYMIKIQKMLAKVIYGLEKLEKKKISKPGAIQTNKVNVKSMYDFHLDIFESLKPSTSTKPVTRYKSVPSL